MLDLVVTKNETTTSGLSIGGMASFNVTETGADR